MLQKPVLRNKLLSQQHKHRCAALRCAVLCGDCAALLTLSPHMRSLSRCMQTFFVDDDLKENCQLDAVLCLVDSKHITQHLDEVKPEGVVNEAGVVMEVQSPRQPGRPASRKGRPVDGHRMQRTRLSRYKRQAQFACILWVSCSQRARGG